MKEEEKRQFIHKITQGDMSKEDLAILDDLLQRGKLSPDDFEDLEESKTLLDEGILLKPSKSLDIKFYNALQKESSKRNKRVLTMSYWATGIAATLLILAGFFVGQFAQTGQSTSNAFIPGYVNTGQDNVLQMLNESSQGVRLAGALKADAMPEISRQVIDALLFIINYDTNANVRIAGLNALMGFAEDPYVRSGIIQSIPSQESPMVILSLAEVLYAIGEDELMKDFRSRLTKDLPNQVLNEIDKGVQSLY